MKFGKGRKFGNYNDTHSNGTKSTNSSNFCQEIILDAARVLKMSTLRVRKINRVQEKYNNDIDHIIRSELNILDILGKKKSTRRVEFLSLSYALLLYVGELAIYSCLNNNSEIE